MFAWVEITDLEKISEWDNECPDILRNLAPQYDKIHAPMRLKNTVKKKNSESSKNLYKAWKPKASRKRRLLKNVIRRTRNVSVSTTDNDISNSMMVKLLHFMIIWNMITNFLTIQMMPKEMPTPPAPRITPKAHKISSFPAISPRLSVHSPKMGKEIKWFSEDRIVHNTEEKHAMVIRSLNWTQSGLGKKSSGVLPRIREKNASLEV